MKRYGLTAGGRVRVSKELIWSKAVHQRPHRHLGPISDHFSADTIRISKKNPVPKANRSDNGIEPVPEPVRMAITRLYVDRQVSKASA